MRRFDAARIDDSHAWAFLSSDYPPDQGMNGVHDVLDDALQFPFSEVVIDGLTGSKVAWQHSPLKASSVNVKNSVHDLPTWTFALSFLWINDFFDNLPLLISEVS